MAKGIILFGLVVKFIVHDGKRDDFVEIMSAGMQGMAGCHSYILAEDVEEPNKVWATEIWESHEAHTLAMGTDTIQEVIKRAKPFMVGRDMRVVTSPKGGQGLSVG